MRRLNARTEPHAQAQARAQTKNLAFNPIKMGHAHPRRRGLALLAAAAFCLLLLLLPRASPPPRYGIVIDAGSTGSRVHVIAYRDPARGGAPPRVDWKRTANLKASPGLSAFAADPGAAGRSLVPLVEFARRRVPPARWANTEVRLMATAGLRLLDGAAAEAVLNSCREVLRESGFQFDDEWATVISGAEEGIYAWVAANNALGTLGCDPKETTGIIELGGASAQVTFVTDEPLPPEFAHVLKLGEATYNLYSHSFLHLGQNVAYESLHDLLSSPDLKSTATHLIHSTKYSDPCTPRGYLHKTGVAKLPASVIEAKVQYRPVAHAVGNFSECRSAALTLLQKGKEECTYHECRLGATFVPNLEGKFLATENFYHTSKFFGLRPKAFLSGLMRAGEQFCHEDWSKIKKKYRSFDETELLLFCFSSAYIVALLHDTLKMPVDDKRIDVVSQIDGMPVDWALGAFIVQKSLNQTEYLELSVSYLNSYEYSGLLPLFFITTVVFIYSMLHPEVTKTSPEDNIRHGERLVHHNQGQPMSLARSWELVEFLQWGSDHICKFS